MDNITITIITITIIYIIVVIITYSVQTIPKCFDAVPCISNHGDMMLLWWTGATQDTKLIVLYVHVYILYFKVSLEDGHLGQATPHDILYVHCELLHLNFVKVICREINFDLI